MSTTPDPAAPSGIDGKALDGDKAERLELVNKCITALHAVAERLEGVEQVLGRVLPDVIKEQPLGVAVDLISELKIAMDVLHGDGSSVVTNRVKQRVSYVREVTIPSRFDTEQVKTFNTDRFRVTRTVNIRASILSGDIKEDAFQWLEDNELGSLIKPTVNASSLSSAAKELIETGKELPEELFRVHYQDGTSITKLKPKRS